MAATLQLSTDDLLTTTRSVRRRLDLERPVEREVLLECLRIAQQAPTGNGVPWCHFVIVTDPEKRAGLAHLFRRAVDIYRDLPYSAYNIKVPDPELQARMPHISSSLESLYEHLQEVPVHLLACLNFRLTGEESVKGEGPFLAATFAGSVYPACWSFMLAARSRGLASCLTTLHLLFEEEVARLLDIPYDRVTQEALIPVAYARGTDFKPAYRSPLEGILHWNSW
jgi:nitroreductase